MIHTETIAVGEGLIRAYKLESSTAIYPRIVLDESILDEFEEMESQCFGPPLRKKDLDGLWFLHILEPRLIKMCSHTSISEYEHLNNPYMELGKKEIEENLRQAKELSVKAKLTWLASYFNKYAGDIGISEIDLE